jgi:hypothetical protein
VKLLAWNIQHGGGARLPRIVEEITAYDPDVIVVAEFGTGYGRRPEREGIAKRRDDARNRKTRTGSPGT